MRYKKRSFFPNKRDITLFKQSLVNKHNFDMKKRAHDKFQSLQYSATAISVTKSLTFKIKI